MLGQIRSVSSLDCYHFYHELNALKQCNMKKLRPLTPKYLGKLVIKTLRSAISTLKFFDRSGYRKHTIFLFGLIMNWLV